MSESRNPSGRDQEVAGVEEVHSLIIVARDQPELYHALKRQLGEDPKVRILSDRRRWRRRQLIQWYESDQRGQDRRRPPSLEHDVGQRSFVIIRQQDGAFGN
jgi:hypothetical protein